MAGHRAGEEDADDEGGDRHQGGRRDRQRCRGGEAGERERRAEAQVRQCRLRAAKARSPATPLAATSAAPDSASRSDPAAASSFGIQLARQ
jgi:hypothetical protein